MASQGQSVLAFLLHHRTIVAAHTRLLAGQDPITPRTDLSLTANFLYMVFSKEPDPIVAKALDTYWVTVIDHGMNASTFAARVIASTRSDLVSAVTGAIGALKGPLHGGAPGPVLDMLHDIRSVGNADPWVRNEIAAGRRIMGFGHRVYKVRDPLPRKTAAKRPVPLGGGGAGVVRGDAQRFEPRGTSAWRSSQPVDTQPPLSHDAPLPSRGSRVRVAAGAPFLLDSLRNA